MIIKKTLVLSLLTVATTAWTSQMMAQNSNPSNLTSSPYTRYGFGKLGTVGNASLRGMGDAGIALRTNQYTNLYNPASLTGIDTLTMLFDTAIEAQMFSMSEQGKRESGWNAGFSYLTFHFPLWNRFAGAISYMPYSMVGYEYGNVNKESIESTLFSNDTISTTNSYAGNGGLQHFQLSMAWNPIKKRTQRLDMGLTTGYICGNIGHTSSMVIGSGHGNSTSSLRGFSCVGWDLTLGTQYTQQIVPGKYVTLGATFSPRTHISCDRDIEKQSGLDFETTKTRLNLSVPQKVGFGICYQLDRKLTVSADYSLEQWSNVKGLDEKLNRKEDVYQDLYHFSAGVEYRPKLYAQGYFPICLYRAGVEYRNSYVKAFSNQKEYVATCGIGLPVAKRSILNFAISYTHVQPDNSSLLKENFLGITFGLTFNEMMFYRSKLR